MRVAIVYDCLFPHTVGGAERWCRALAERLSDRHEVVYLTRRQWGEEGPGTRFATVAVSPGGELYAWTVDDPRRIAALEALGVDGVITNDPRLFAR